PSDDFGGQESGTLGIAGTFRSARRLVYKAPEPVHILGQLAKYKVRSVATKIGLTTAFHVQRQHAAGVGLGLEQRTGGVASVLVFVAQDELTRSNRVGGDVLARGQTV